MLNILIGDIFNSRKFYFKKSDNFDYYELLLFLLKKKFFIILYKIY